MTYDKNDGGYLSVKLSDYVKGKEKVEISGWVEATIDASITPNTTETLKFSANGEPINAPVPVGECGPDCEGLPTAMGKFGWALAPGEDGTRPGSVVVQTPGLTPEMAGSETSKTFNWTDKTTSPDQAFDCDKASKEGLLSWSYEGRTKWGDPKYDTAEELDVVVHHVPFHLVASGYPMVLIDRLVAFDAYEVMAGRQVTIEIRRCDRNLFVLHETTRRILDDGKGFGQHLFQHFFILIGNLLFDFIYFRPDRFAFFQFFFVDSLTQFFDAFFLFAHVIPYALADVCRTGAQFIVRERFNGRVGRLDFIHVRCNFF